jgi:hypothetical protein
MIRGIESGYEIVGLLASFQRIVPKESLDSPDNRRRIRPYPGRDR